MASSLDDSARTVSGPDASGTCAAAGDANHLPPAETTDKPDADAAFVVHGYKLYAIMVGICFGAFMMSLDVFVIATAIPSITSEFHDTSNLAWYPAAYSFTTCALTPLAGKLTTVFTLRWVYIVFFSIFLVGSIICGWAPNSEAFIVGRAIAGIGASGVGSGGLTVVLTISSEKVKPLFMGIISSFFALGLILAPVLGGVFTEKITWRWCFWINLPPGALTLAVMLVFFKPPSRARPESLTKSLLKLDLIGCFFFIPAIFMLLLALTWGGTKEAWNSATTIGLFVGSGVMLIVFVCWEGYKGNDAMIPGIVLSRRTVTFSVLFSFCHLGSLAISSYYLPEWFQAVQGASPLESGTRILATVLAQITGTISAGILSRVIKYYNPFLFVGPAFMCTAAALYTQFTAFDTPSSHWIGFQVINGLGVGMAQQMPSLTVQLALKDREDLLPIGVALNLFAQYLGATFTQVIGGVVFRSILSQQLVEAGLSASQIAMLSAAGTANVRATTEQYIPNLLRPVLEAYNTAITSTFFVPVVTTACGFFVAFGIKWTRIGTPQKKIENQEAQEDIELTAQQSRH
ncbi:putative MFS transporter [Hypoxylon rubiginosum]|uniref:MFS transporter n=1 Tax=Hypoxylon rubiginosum TaxID=110542 RepID=A0ACC0CZU3_9PEZI|nr:putative MFS transporter [Hypoxylon rubiginosum]